MNSIHSFIHLFIIGALTNGPESNSPVKNCTNALKIEIEEDVELADEFSASKSRPLQSPHSKMPVVQSTAANASNVAVPIRSKFATNILQIRVNDFLDFCLNGRFDI